MRISDWSSDVCSSDLVAVEARSSDRFFDHATRTSACSAGSETPCACARRIIMPAQGAWVAGPHMLPLRPNTAEASRSEEHTSELQSLMRISYAVFCLKKKKNARYTAHYT